MKRAFVFFFTIAFSLGSLSAIATAKDNWLRIRSKNFTFVGNAGQGDMRKVAVRLELFREVFAQIFPSTKLSASVPTTVLIFRTDDSYKPFKPKRDGKTKNVAGYFLPTPDGNYVTMSMELEGDDPFKVIFHEYVHSLINNNLSNVPLWLNEGLAEYYSTFKASDDNKRVRLGTPVSYYLRILEARGLLPLGTLLEVDTRSPHYNESNKVGIFYAQSWAFVHYLLLDNNAARRPQLTRFLSRLNAGIPLEVNFRQSFQADYATMERELDGYIKRFKFPVMDVEVEKAIDVDKELTSAPVAEAEVQFILADLLLSALRDDEALPYLEKSIALDPKFASSLTALGIVRYRNREITEAKKVLQQAMEADADNYLARFYYGNVLLQERESEKAVESFKKAAALKPDLAYLHQHLGSVFSELGRDEEATEAYTQALRSDSRSVGTYYLRAFINLRRGRGNHAAADAMSFLNLKGWREKESLFMALVAYLGCKREGRMQDADRNLDLALARSDSSLWPYPILRYLKGAITETQLIAASKDNDQLTESHAYVGLNLSAAGKREEALTHLRWVRDNGNKRFVEYPMALRELERLEGAGKMSDKL